MQSLHISLRITKDKKMGLNVGELVGSGLTGVAKGVSDIVHSWITTKKDKVIQESEAKELDFQMQQFMMENSLKIMEAVSRADEAQNVVNAKEAESGNIFVSGWRPFVGWICGSGLAIQFVIGPFATWISALFGHKIDFPQLDMGTLLTLLGGMLGLGTLRTYEKLNGVASTSLVK